MPRRILEYAEDCIARLLCKNNLRLVLRCSLYDSKALSDWLEIEVSSVTQWLAQFGRLANHTKQLGWLANHTMMTNLVVRRRRKKTRKAIVRFLEF